MDMSPTTNKSNFIVPPAGTAYILEVTDPEKLPEELPKISSGLPVDTLIEKFPKEVSEAVLSELTLFRVSKKS